MELKPPFVDWLTIKQHHKEFYVPPLNQGKVVSIDADGSIEWFRDRSIQHSGSFDTRIMIRSYDGIVELSGNVGGFNRPDNVWGYTLSECVVKANRILETFDLPAFYAGQKYIKSSTAKIAAMESYDLAEYLTVAYSGATVSRIDLTTNFSAGSQEDLKTYLYYLNTVKSTRMRVSAHGENDTIQTVSHGLNSKYKSIVIYDKYQEFLRHKKNQIEYDKTGYYPNLLNYLKDNGLIRFELRLKRLFLKKHNLSYLGLITDDKLKDIFFDAVESNLKPVDFSLESNLSRPAWLTLQQWRSGVRIQKSKSTFYLHRREILDLLGIDISNSYNSFSKNPSVINKVLTVKPCEIPEFYYLPH